MAILNDALTAITLDTSSATTTMVLDVSSVMMADDHGIRHELT
jgi:hypothetical protein